jgi:type VI secretion system protein ImpH
VTGATEGVPEDALFPARARLHYASLFASRRSAAGIEDALQHLLRQPIVIQEFQPRWRAMEPDDHSRLGRSFCQLGSDMVLGRKVRVASDAFRVVARAASFRDYEALLPTGQRFAIAAEALEAFAPSHLEWDLMIEIEEQHAPPARLDGRARLGWTGWLGRNRNGSGLRADAHLTKRARPKRAKRGEAS